MNKTKTLSYFLNRSSYENVVIRNKYYEILCEGNPGELRQNTLWQLIDEEGAIVEKVHLGTDTAGDPATHIVLGNFPLHNRSLEQLQSQLAAFKSDVNFNEIADNNEHAKLYNAHIEALQKHIDAATMQLPENDLAVSPGMKLKIEMLVETGYDNPYDLTENILYLLNEHNMREKVTGKPIKVEDIKWHGADTMAVRWSVDDVMTVRPDLTEEQAMEVLLDAENYHDAEIGINWDVLRIRADELFPETK